MPGKRKLFSAKGDRAIKDIIRESKKYHRKVNAYAIATARVPGARLKKRRK
jgi:hypothetical protein